MKAKKIKKLVYLDHAATTPVDSRVLKAMQPYWSEKFANPSALYKAGLEAKAAIDSARASIAEILHCKPFEIIFTAGGTESNNLAIFGLTKEYQKVHGPGHIITTPIEHHSVLRVMDTLKDQGWKISYAPVNSEGFVDLQDLKKLVKKNTALVSIMYANNEVGTVEPIEEVGKWLNGLNKVRQKNGLPRIAFHSDACQASGALSLDVQNLKVDLLTLNGSKIYGPKQTGLLFVRSGIKLEPIIHGGGQERDLRSGTENVPGIVGLAAALEIAQKDALKENKRLQSLQNYFYDRLLKKVDNIKLNGPSIKQKNKSKFAKKELRRLPNNINITFKDIEGESLMLYLDSKGIAVSTGSACATTSLDPSHVLIALGSNQKDAYSAVRFTMGHETTKESINYVIKALVELAPMLRSVSKL